MVAMLIVGETLHMCVWGGEHRAYGDSVPSSHNLKLLQKIKSIKTTTTIENILSHCDPMLALEKES